MQILVGMEWMDATEQIQQISISLKEILTDASSQTPTRQAAVKVNVSEDLRQCAETVV